MYHISTTCLTSVRHIMLTVAATLMWQSGLTNTLTRSSYIGWNKYYFRPFYARQVGCRTVRLKVTNSWSESKVLLLTVEECDRSKTFPSDNRHVQQCCLLTTKGKDYQSPTLKIPHLTLPHRFPYLAVRPFEVRN